MCSKVSSSFPVASKEAVASVPVIVSSDFLRESNNESNMFQQIQSQF